MRMEHGAEWRAKRTAESLAEQRGRQAVGLCRIAGCPAPIMVGSRAHCAAHVLLLRVKARRRAKANPWRVGGPGRPPLPITKGASHA